MAAVKGERGGLRESETHGRAFDAVVVGAGFAGIRMLYELRSLGLSVRVLEKASGPGGTWYWNRYPGRGVTPRLGSTAFLFDDELLQEWDWPERFPGQSEIESYFDHVLDRYDLRADIDFDTEVASAVFDEGAERWTITTAAGDTFECTYFISATGVLHAALDPPFRARTRSAASPISPVSGRWSPSVLSGNAWPLSGRVRPRSRRFRSSRPTPNS